MELIEIPTRFQCSFITCSDPPLSEEDIPAGLWLCHMCQMLQKQRTSNTSKLVPNDDDLTQHEIVKLKDSRPSTPITSDGVINAAKVRLSQKRSLSRVSSSSENSSSSDRDIKSKISRIDSDQCSNSNGVVEIMDSIGNSAPATNENSTPNENDGKNGEEPKPPIEDVQIESTVQLNEESEFKKPCEEIKETVEKPPEIIDLDQNEETQVESQPEEDIEDTTANEDDQTNAQNSEENEELICEEETTDFKSPFDELIRAASILNPRQFELPRELAIFPQFPGDEKSKI